MINIIKKKKKPAKQTKTKIFTIEISIAYDDVYPGY